VGQGEQAKQVKEESREGKPVWQFHFWHKLIFRVVSLLVFIQLHLVTAQILNPAAKTLSLLQLFILSLQERQSHFLLKCFYSSISFAQIFMHAHSVFLYNLS